MLRVPETLTSLRRIAENQLVYLRDVGKNDPTFQKQKEFAESCVTALKSAGGTPDNCVCCINDPYSFVRATEENPMQAIIICSGSREGADSLRQAMTMWREEKNIPGEIYVIHKNALRNVSIDRCSITLSDICNQLISGEYVMGEFDPKRVHRLMRKEQRVRDLSDAEMVRELKSLFWYRYFTVQERYKPAAEGSRGLKQERC